jgi:hypothetical protein
VVEDKSVLILERMVRGCVGHVGVLSAEQRIDVDLGTGAGRLRTFSGEHGIDLFEADRGGDERSRIDRAARVRRNGGVETRRA